MNRETKNDLFFSELESKTPEYISNKDFVVIRMDGCHFHTITEKLHPIYDPYFQYVLNRAYKHVIQLLSSSGLTISYSFSDEISIVLEPTIDDLHIRLFNGKMTKLLSVLPSCLASAFKIELYKAKNENYFPESIHTLFEEMGNIYSYIEDELELFPNQIDDYLLKNIYFDCKIFSTPHKYIVEKYLYNRYRYARKGCINAIGNVFYSEEMLHKKSTENRYNMIKEDYNIDTKLLPLIVQFGFIYKRPNASIMFDYNNETCDLLSTTILNQIH